MGRLQGQARLAFVLRSFVSLALGVIAYRIGLRAGLPAGSRVVVALAATAFFGAFLFPLPEPGELVEAAGGPGLGTVRQMVAWLAALWFGALLARLFLVSSVTVRVLIGLASFGAIGYLLRPARKR